MSLAAAFLRFAEEEARGRSAAFEAFARGVAGDPVLLGMVEALPPGKRQPNLLFAAVRHIAGTPPDWPTFRRAMVGRWAEVAAVMAARSTQTNEPARCATLLPVLAGLPQPLALLEVGASAGLCLLPDRYGYSYGGHAVGPPDGVDAPVFPCEAGAGTPLPDALPRVAWRAGLDLNPLDVGDAGQMDWLETLVWPGNPGRAERLRAAIRIARAEPPRIVRGDLRTTLPALAAQAPAGATRVVFHTAVLAYVADQSEREAFAAAVARHCDVWISNESPRVLPGVAARLDGAVRTGRFVMAVNGVPVAWTDPHGAAIDWIRTPGTPP